MSYKTRIILYFSVIIAVFTTGIILFEQQQIKNERTKSLENILESNADIIYNYISKFHIAPDSMVVLGDFVSYFPENLRVTIVDDQGKVLYDNKLSDVPIENHINRPEIQKSIGFGNGTNIRKSDSNQIKYLYYAKKYPEGFFIRVAFPYDVQLRTFLSANNSFIYYILLFFVICVGLMINFANQFSKSIKKLKEFSTSLKVDNPLIPAYTFPNDEVGEISADIVDNYHLLQENRKKLALEREKLLQHFHYSEEGIAIFSDDRKKIYANSHFLQYLNVIIDKPTLEVENIFSDINFDDITQFIDRKIKKETVFSQRIEKNGKQFHIRVIVFDDESFEIYISDITKQEKTRLLKQEMTNNIAHELRTPVTSIRGYLETLQALKENDVERRNNFLERALMQSIRLSELIQDISMLTKIEEAANRFRKEKVDIKELLEGLSSDLAEKLRQKNINFIVDLDQQIVIYGNRTLLYSIFRNLAENSIFYGGEGIEIVIKGHYGEDENFYFEFYDNGVGVEEKYLVKIFERFYRVNEGRTRNTGGSGLGLSIVKNAVLFHKGNIIAKNRAEGGLIFLITIPKTKEGEN